MIKIEYDHQRPMPEHIRALAEPLLEKYKWMIPPWIHTFHVQYEHGEALAIAMNPQYLRLTLRIGHDFYVMTDEERTRGIIHEFMHAYTSLQFMEFMDVLDEHSELSEGTHKTLERVMTQKMEMATEGLASLVLRLVEGGDLGGAEEMHSDELDNFNLEVDVDGMSKVMRNDPRKRPPQGLDTGHRDDGHSLQRQETRELLRMAAQEIRAYHGQNIPSNPVADLIGVILSTPEPSEADSKNDKPYDTKLHGLRHPKVSDISMPGRED